MSSSTITEKLSKISYVMSDGYHFIKLRFLLEDLEKDTDNEAVAEAIRSY